MRRTRVRVLFVAGALLVVAAFLPTLSKSVAADSDPDAPVVTMSPNEGITDGQAVTITIKSSEAQPVFSATARMCRGGVDYQTSSPNANRPAVDFEADGANCPGDSHPLSSSSDTGVNDTSTFQNGPTAEGESFLFRVGAGVVKWDDVVNPGPDGKPTPRTLTCDASNPCAVVVELRTKFPDGKTYWKPYVMNVAYGVTDAIAGCGGPADNVLASGGSERMTETWVKLTLAACHLPNAVHGAPSRGSFAGEGVAIEAFGNGIYDLVYTGAGYDDDIGFAPVRDAALPDGGRRPAVAIPIAVNAAVLAVGGGFHPLNADGSTSDHKRAYSDLKITAAEFASMISAGNPGVAQTVPNSDQTYTDQILARNPQLKAGLTDSAAGFSYGAPADGEVVSWYASNYFKQLAPGAWRVPDVTTFGDNKGKARTVTGKFATADPPFSDLFVSLLSGRPALRKGLIGPGANTNGGVYVLTDYETALTLGLYPAKIANAHGDFVEPNQASILAALPSMKKDSRGVRVGDPSAVVPSDGVAPYPMSFVEYALAPAEPLVEDDCTARPESQKLLKDWLTYVTTDGQAQLPKGMTPLPDDLRAEAAEQIKKVGASPITGACAETEQSTIPEATPETSAPTTEDPSTDTPRSSFSDSSLNSFSSIPTSSINTDVPGVPLDNQVTTFRDSSVKTPRVPGFAGAGYAGWIGTLAAIVGIVALSTLALHATSRQ